MSALAPFIDGEVVSVHVEPAMVEPAPPAWLRLAAWWPSLFALVVAVSLVAGASR